MLMLDRAGLARARSFVRTHGRPLDGALCAWVFGDGSADAVAQGLSAYQTGDGGFGRALEPDFRFAGSSVLATTVGLQYAAAVGLAAQAPVVAGAVGYLVGAYDQAEGRWHAVPRAVNDAPHAPWWSVDPATGTCSVEGTWANPSAEATAWLWRWRSLVPPSLLEEATRRALAELAAMPERLDMHDFLCYARLAEALPAGERDAMRARLSRSVPRMVAADPAAWATYGATPLMLAPTPASPFAAVLGELVDVNLDHVIASVGADGGWWPTWTWGDAHPDVWPTARREWAGQITAQTLRTLAAYGRIAA